MMWYGSRYDKQVSICEEPNGWPGTVVVAPNEAASVTNSREANKSVVSPTDIWGYQLRTNVSFECSPLAGNTWDRTIGFIAAHLCGSGLTSHSGDNWLTRSSFHNHGAHIWRCASLGRS
jgi:hypothetical protein